MSELVAITTLVGGAPRTGTSLLARLLDWAPEHFVFPFEPAVFEKIFFGDRIPAQPWGGKELVFRTRSALSSWRARLEQEFDFKGGGIFQTIDTGRFDGHVTAYQAEHASSGFSVATAEFLARALIASCPALSVRYSDMAHTSYVFKMPFYTDAIATSFLRMSPHRYFIGMDRNPLNRYASAKARRLQVSTEVGVMAAQDYPSFQADLAIATRFLGRSTAMAFPHQYLLVSYEELVKDRVGVMARVAEFLAIAAAPELGVETLFGEHIRTPSSHGSTRLGDETVLDDLLDQEEREYVSMRTSAAFSSDRNRTTALRHLRQIGSAKFRDESAVSAELRRQQLVAMTPGDLAAARLTHSLQERCRQVRPALI